MLINQVGYHYGDMENSQYIKHWVKPQSFVGQIFRVPVCPVEKPACIVLISIDLLGEFRELTALYHVYTTTPQKGETARHSFAFVNPSSAYSKCKKYPYSFITVAADGLAPHGTECARQ